MPCRCLWLLRKPMATNARSLLQQRTLCWGPSKACSQTCLQTCWALQTDLTKIRFAECNILSLTPNWHLPGIVAHTALALSPRATRDPGKALFHVHGLFDFPRILIFKVSGEDWEPWQNDMTASWHDPCVEMWVVPNSHRAGAGWEKECSTGGRWMLNIFPARDPITTTTSPELPFSW